MAFAQSRKLFNIRETLKKMLGRRGYDIPEDIQDETLESFESNFIRLDSDDEKFSLAFTCTRRGAGAENNIMVFFHDDPSRPNIGIGPLREYAQIMSTEGCTESIIVVQEGVTSPAGSMLKELDGRGISMVAFSEKELLVDIYEHERVPRHELLSPDKKRQLLEQMSIDSDQMLPKIQKRDPMAKYLGLKVGDVVRIHRYSLTVGKDIYYRVVVDSEDL